MTSISLCGAHEQTGPDCTTPKFGHPEDRRPDEKRIHAGLMVTGDGGIPIWNQGYDDNAGELARLAAR